MNVQSARPSLSPPAILAHARLREALREQAASFLDIHAAAPRLSSVFATQQRFMMGHVFLALAFRSADRSVLLADFLREVRRHALASPNTAEAFVKEMMSAGFVANGPARRDKRCRPLVANEHAFQLIGLWLGLHLRTLDRLDGSSRASVLDAAPQLVAGLQPLISDGLLNSPTCVQPTGTFSLFSWQNDGGLVMERLIASLPPFPDDVTRVPTGYSSYADLEQDLRISRTHMIRKLGMAERLGSLGWEGQRSRSALWVSRTFIAEYDTYQAEKLAIIDRAFQQVVRMSDAA